MIRVQSNVVLKYFEAIDEFVRIRRFTPEEADRLLRETQIRNKRSYMALVLNACLLQYNEKVVPIVRDRPPEDRGPIENRLFALCVDVNPHFDLRSVTIEVSDTESSEIHLLEQPAAGTKRDFRRLRDMEKDLSRAVIGQDDAVSSVSRAIRKAMTGLRDASRPISTFFFVGQTGVGKTEMAKALTRYLYDDTSMLLRVDCSEYALPHEYAKLIGAPPGYVGHDEGGVLAEARRKGHPVVLFDEIEKSDRKVHDLLLQLMDEGFVTDNKGRRTEFRNAIIILTSNIGAEDMAGIRDRIGFDLGRRTVKREMLRREMNEALQRTFRSEFINRLTELVVFHPLQIAQCEEIARRFLEEARKHAMGVPLTLRFDRRLARFLAEKAFRPESGAREIRRTVERDVEDPLSDMLIDGKLNEGDRVNIRLRRGRITFSRN